MIEPATEIEPPRPETSSFDEVLPIWRDRLWEGRASQIEPVSAIGPDCRIDLSWRGATPRFWKLSEGGRIVGVISTLSLSSVRLRGLWVAESTRGKGYGQRLVAFAMAEAAGAPFVWTMARQSAERLYRACGLEAERVVEGYEFGPHVLMKTQVNL